MVLFFIITWTFPDMEIVQDNPDPHVGYPSLINLSRDGSVILKDHSVIDTNGDQSATCHLSDEMQCQRHLVCRITNTTKLTGVSPVTNVPFQLREWNDDSMSHVDKWHNITIGGGEALLFTPVKYINESCFGSCQMNKYVFGQS
jgi:hypothetical protein